MWMVVISKEDVSFSPFSMVFVASANCLLVDYNSWIESDKGRKLAASLPKDVVLAEGAF